MHSPEVSLLSQFDKVGYDKRFSPDIIIGPQRRNPSLLPALWSGIGLGVDTQVN